MTLSTHSQMAESIAERLNASQFSMPFRAYRRNLPRVSISDGDLDDLRCDVMPLQESGERSSRGSYQHDYKFQVGFRKKIAVTDDDEVEAELDKITVCIEQALEVLKKTQPLGAHGALASFETITPVDLTELQSARIAVCVLSLTFTGTRFPTGS